MATKVSYIDRTGNPAGIILGNRKLAEEYAKTVKNAVLTEVDVAAPKVTVKVCPPGTRDAQAEASDRFYAPIKAARKGVLVEEGFDAENEAERKMEHFSQAHLAGQASEDAHADWEYLQSGRRS
jgi:hypothetical protein